MAKALSLKLDEPTYLAAEKIRKQLKPPRNSYIRKAVTHNNALYARKLLEKEYRKARAGLARCTWNISKKPSCSKSFPKIYDTRVRPPLRGCS